MGPDEIGRNGTGWDGMGLNGTGWDEMGRDGTGHPDMSGSIIHRKRAGIKACYDSKFFHRQTMKKYLHPYLHVHMFYMSSVRICGHM